MGSFIDDRELKIGQRCRVVGTRKFGELVRVGPALLTLRLDDGTMQRFGRHRVVSRSQPKPKRRSAYPPAVVALARANGVSCKLVAEWRPDLMGA